MMQPEYALRLVSRLAPGTMLDVGTRDGRMARRFAELGYQAHAIDPKPVEPMDLIDGMTFDKCRLEEFAAPEPFDLVIASCVSHLVSFETPELLAKLCSLTAPGGLIFVTLIGRKDEWAEHAWARATDIDCATAIAKTIGIRPLYSTSECFDGRLYDGTPKHWNLLSFVFETHTHTTHSAAASAAPWTAMEGRVTMRESKL